MIEVKILILKIWAFLNFNWHKRTFNWTNLQTEQNSNRLLGFFNIIVKIDCIGTKGDFKRIGIWWLIVRKHSEKVLIGAENLSKVSTLS